MDKSVLQLNVIKHLLAACSVTSEKYTVKPDGHEHTRNLSLPLNKFWQFITQGAFYKMG